MPQEYMSESVFLTASPARTRSPVMGQMPPLARVAAITAPLSAVHSTEHICQGQGGRPSGLGMIRPVADPGGYIVKPSP